MPVAAVIGAALTDHSAHPYSLWVGGLDVIKEPGSTGMGVPLESIEMVEAGPGDVSSLHFVIDDPNKTVSIPNPIGVLFYDNVNSNVLFRGFTDRAIPAVGFGGQGRTLSVGCSGLEILLDWIMVPAGYVVATYSAFGGNQQVPQNIGNMVQAFAPMLHAPSGPPFYTDPNYTQNGSFNYPVGAMSRAAVTIVPQRYLNTTAALSGGSLRQMIQEILQDSEWDLVGAGPNLTINNGVAACATVDFYYNFRLWEDGAGLQPDDYTTLTISDTYAGPNRAANLDVQVDWSGVIRTVVVVGFDAASSDTFSDGTGIMGQSALVNDTTITTHDKAAARAGAIMAAAYPFARGSFDLEDWSPPTTVHAGSLVSVTDSATSVATTYRIREIRKNFQGDGTQNWHVTFGDLPPPSAAKEIKRLVHPLRGRAA